MKAVTLGSEDPLFYFNVNPHWECNFQKRNRGPRFTQQIQYTVFMFVFEGDGQRGLPSCIFALQAQNAAVDKGLQDQQLACFCSGMYGAFRNISVKGFMAPCSIGVNTDCLVWPCTLLQGPFCEFNVAVKGGDVQGYSFLIPE